VQLEGALDRHHQDHLIEVEEGEMLAGVVEAEDKEPALHLMIDRQHMLRVGLLP